MTRTDNARLPGGMIGGRPAPASFEASFAGRIGSFFTTDTIRPRSTIASRIFERAFGHGGRGPVERREILAPQLPAEREVGVGHDDLASSER